MNDQPTPPPVINPAPVPPKPRRTLRLVLVLVAAVGAVGWAVAEVRDRSRPALAMIRGLRSSQATDRRTAAEGLTGLNMEDAWAATPALTKALGDPDEEANLIILRALSEAAMLSYTERPDLIAFTRSTTATIARGLADERAPVRAETARILAQFANLKVGEAGLTYDPVASAETLARLAFDDPVTDVRFEAMQTLIQIAKRAPVDPPAMLAATLADPKRPADLRGLAAALLGAFPQGRTNSEPILVAALQDTDGKIRRGAVVGLATFKPDELKPALAPLTAILAEPALSPADYRQPSLVIYYAPKSTNLLVASMAKLKTDAQVAAIGDPTVSAEQAVAVIANGPTPDDEAVQALAGMLKEGQPVWRREEAAALLNQLGRKATAATDSLVATLVAALDDPQTTLIPDLIQAVGKTAPRTSAAGGAVAALDKALTRSDDETLIWATLTVGRFGADAKPALPALQPLTKNANLNIRNNATRSIKAIENPEPPRERRPSGEQPEPVRQPPQPNL